MSSTQLVEARKNFELQLDKEGMTEKIQNFLGDSIPVEKFKQVVLRAVTEDPDLLMKDRTSLLIACSNAAQDGLMPDKQEGALVVYRGKVQWQPMVGGLRKLLAQVGFSVRAEVVCANDTHFDYALGQNPYIEHKPCPIGTDRGQIMGAYAVATGPDGKQYMRVLDRQKLDKIKAVSTAKNGPWKTWEDAMCEKSAVKALVKVLPIDSSDEGMARLQTMIDRDNSQEFKFGSGHAPTTEAQDIQNKIRKLHPEPEDQPEIDPEPAPDAQTIEGELVDPF